MNFLSDFFLIKPFIPLNNCNPPPTQLNKQTKYLRFTFLQGEEKNDLSQSQLKLRRKAWGITPLPEPSQDTAQTRCLLETLQHKGIRTPNVSHVKGRLLQ